MTSSSDGETLRLNPALIATDVGAFEQALRRR